MKLVHAADLHLDSPLRGLERYEGAPVDKLRGATRRAFEALIDACLEEDVRALLLAGDIYDGDWRDYSTGLFFAAQLARLRETGARVFIISGNHDAANKMTRQLRLPEGVVQLGVDRAETHCFEELAVHGQGFARREVREDLSLGYPPPVAGHFNIGLLHTALDGREGHDPYAPCTVPGLAARGYDYWALGHVHAHEVVSEAPYIVYPGNLQGRHARETGPKGAVFLEVEGGRVTRLEHRALDVVRWTRLTLDVAGADDLGALDDRFREALDRAVDDAGGRLVAARVELVGATPLHARLVAEREAFEAGLRGYANELGGAAWIEKVALRTRPALDRDALLAGGGPIAALLEGLDATRADDEGLRALGAELAHLDKKLPAEAKQGPERLDFEDPTQLRELLSDAEALLLSRLAGGEP